MMAVGRVLIESGVWCVVWIVLFDCIEECVDDVDFREQTRGYLYLCVSTYNPVHHALSFENMVMSSVIQNNDLPSGSI